MGYSPLLKPIIIRGSETAKVDCPERVGINSIFSTRPIYDNHA
jgi:hypothetical protein